MIDSQRYSRYLPLYPNEPKSRKTSVVKDNEVRGKRERDRENVSRASVDSTANKRRLTMNSRQALDDEEAFQRVLEESRGEKEPAPSISASRKGKRSRDDSEE